MGMKSKSTEQVRQEMQKTFQQIKEKLPEAELIDSVIDGADNHIAKDGDSIGLWYLGKSLQMLAEADLVFFINDWQEFRGCSVERKCAEAYGKMCVDFKTT